MKLALDQVSRKLQLAVALLCLTTIATSAEALHWVRAITSNGSGNACDQDQCDDVACAVKVGPDNDVYITGRFSGTVQFAGTTLVSAGVRKGTSRDEVATSAAYDRKGHLYVTGVFQGETVQQNVFVMKFAERKLLWTKVATNAGFWVGNNTVISPAISVGKNGRIFVTGAYQGTASFGRITLYGTGAADIFLAELAPD